MTYDVQAHAELLCDWSLAVEPGDAVLLEGPELALPLLTALHAAVLERGAWPALRLSVETLSRTYVDLARDGQLDAPNPIDVAELGAATKLVRIYAPSGHEPLSGADPERVARYSRGREDMRRIALALPWSLTLAPTPELARRADLSLQDYEAFVHQALMLDRPDPTAAWRDLSEVQAALCARLARATTIQITGPGTDLTLEVGGRTWRNSDGKRNLPSGEVFTGPVEHTATGEVYFAIPSYRPAGLVSGVRLAFRAGRVVEASAEVGQEILDAELATDEGAKLLGEIGIGTSPGITRPTGSTLLDEKLSGTVHLALGASYPETGGVNRSAIHWDLICDLRSGGSLTADGSPVLVDGALA